MTAPNPSNTRPPIRLERTYEAAVEELWALWSTKDGFEAWWGPEGFRVEVRQWELREGGVLHYDMIADGPEQIAFMQNEGMPISHEVRGTFTRIEPHKCLEITHLIDFIPGVGAYENRSLVEFFPEGNKVRMVITVDPHQDDEWTQRASMGLESQLTKLPAALEARRG